MCVYVYVGQRYRGYFTKYPYVDQSARKYHGRTFGAIDLDKHSIHKTEAMMSLVHLLQCTYLVSGHFVIACSMAVRVIVYGAIFRESNLV